MIGIYKITSPSGKVYVGQSINIERRFKTYARGSLGSQYRLERSFKKYGFENHLKEVLLSCEKTELNENEFYFQKLYNCIGDNGLNCVIHDIKNKTKEFYEETRVKNSNNRKAEKNPMYGKKLSPEHRLKISLSNKGKVANNKGVKLSKETKLKIKENNSKYWLGKKYSLEKRQKMSDESIAKKTVINLETGIFFYSVKEAADAHNINYNSLMGMINPNKHTHRNKTSLVYV